MDDATPKANFHKQAIVVIHGIGEQTPMETITGFVRAVWQTDRRVTRNGMPRPAEVWSKPDRRTGSLELRRITTRQSRPSAAFPDGVRSDFYELYWADLSAGSTLAQVETWLFGLLLRNPFTAVPPRVRLAWLLMWLVSLVVVVLAAAAALPDIPRRWPPFSWIGGWPTWALTLVTLVLAVFSSRLLLPYAGRVVRYTRARPDNIAARAAIRERGLALLGALHDRDYDRIVVVGHSLGTILAYDLVSQFWASRDAARTVARDSDAFAALKSAETAVSDVELRKPDAPARFDQARRALLARLRARPKPEQPGEPDKRWLISDLVTLGSPLTHAEFLMTSGRRDLRRRKETREFPICPPVREVLDPKMVAAAQAACMPLDDGKSRLMSFESAADHWQLHHAAPFAVVKWTNIHDPSRFVLCGDLISGPLAPVFGPGVEDIDLAKLRGRSWRFTHTRYWTADKGKRGMAPLKALRVALDLAGDRL